MRDVDHGLAVAGKVGFARGDAGYVNRRARGASLETDEVEAALLADDEKALAVRAWSWVGEK